MRKLKHLFMLCLFAMISIGASATVYSDKCGENAQWSLDTTTGVLSITGSGNMSDYSTSSSIPWYKYRSYVKSLYIGDQITSIGRKAFYDCSGLTSVTIPNSVTSIGSEAFEYCPSLKSVTIPNSVTSIGGHTFTYCTGLTSVAIPKSVTSIGNQAFSNCTSLTSVNITDLSKWAEIEFESSDANPLYYAHNLYLNGQLVIEAKLISARNIGRYAFYNYSNMTSVSIGNSATSIGNYAFYGCSGLKSVTIGNSVTSIGREAFYDCSGLTSVTIPNSVTSIGSSTFYGCSGLTSVTIPNSVTSIGGHAFRSCTSLTSVAIPNSVTSIGSNAFYECYSLTSVTIGKSVTSIGDNAFDGCTKLTSVHVGWIEAGKIPRLSKYNVFPYSTCDLHVTAGTKAIYQGKSYWESFRNIIETSNTTPCISISLTPSTKNLTIGEATTLTAIVLPEDATDMSVTWKSDNESVATIVDGVVTAVATGMATITATTNDGSNLSSRCVITVGKAEIPDNEIWYTSSDANVVTPYSNNVFGTSIVSNTYTNGKGVIKFNDNVTSIDDNAFNKCSSLTTMTIPNSVTEIGDYAFADCSGLTSIVIPNLVNSIGNYAFEDCSGLTSMTIPNSVTSIGDYAFRYCSGLKNLTIGNSVTSIGGSAFLCCSGLTIVTIPNSVTSIKSSAFNSCSGLICVPIGNSVTSIGSSAFSGCSGLTSVAIPNSVTSIDNYAFYECSNLTIVHVGWKEVNKIPSLSSSYVFPYSTCDLYVPDGTKAIYQGKTLWNTFKNIVEFEPNIIITNIVGTDGSISAKEGDNVALNDKIKSISIAKGINNVNVTYTRNFEKAGVWQAWYMPFDVAFDDMKGAYDVAQIHGVLLDKDNNAVLAFLKLDKGTVNANTPYVVRPKKNGEVAITTTTDLQPTQSNSFLMMSATDKYTIGGVFEKTTTPGNWYALNLDGQFQLMGSGVYLRPFRIYMTIDPRTDNPYAQSATTTAKMDIVVIGDGETTGIKESLTPALSEGKGAIYNLSGLRVNSIQKGQIYIMNGKKYIAK